MTKQNIDHGTWYQSAISGLWYQDKAAAEPVCAVRVDGITTYIGDPDDE